MAAWVSTGSNLPFSAEHIQSGLASWLPQVVDKLTSDGNLPSANNVGDLLSGLGNLFGNIQA
ncbi:MAG: hypothetical protein WCT35_02290 [Sideroxydans sp.]